MMAQEFAQMYFSKVVNYIVLGVQIKMKKNIHHLLEILSRKGLSILIISDENDEIFSVCQRYIVLNEGKLTGDISKREIEKAELGLAIQNEVDR